MKRKKQSLPFPDFFQNKSLAWVAVLISVIALFGGILAFWLSWLIGCLWLVLVCVALMVIFKTFTDIGHDTADYISALSTRVEKSGQEGVLNMPVAILLYDDDEIVSWVNPYLQSQLGTEVLIGKPLASVSPQMADIVHEWPKLQAVAMETDEPCAAQLRWLEHDFKVHVQTDIQALYFFDVTENTELKQALDDHELMIGLVSVDNYDEVTESMSDASSSALRSYITSALDTWMKERNIYTRRIAVDRFLLIGYQSGLQVAEKDKFGILDDIREATSAQNTPITLSMGISYEMESIQSMASQAQSNLDLALGRGGDQVVVKQQDGEARFYGGTTNPMAKRTRVRARVISQALTDLVSQADQVFIMGHNRSDMDSFGAALGVRRLAQMWDKPSWVVYDEDQPAHSDIELLLATLKTEPRDEHALIKPEQALAQATDHSLLIMVDHSRPSITEDRALYERLREHVVIIDHHRRSEEFPEEPLLVYIESYASSTSELVTELFEYQPSNARSLTRVEATAMLAGIQIDTKSFTVRSGTRTFDAASYLRSLGADGAMIQELMKESVTSYRDRAHLIERVEIYDAVALVQAEDDVIYDPVVVAQTADSMMQMIGVKMSYVIARRDDTTVAISARSDGSANVQIVMEKMGGGGHLSNAATQLKETTTDVAREQLLQILVESEAISAPAE